MTSLQELVRMQASTIAALTDTVHTLETRLNTQEETSSQKDNAITTLKDRVQMLESRNAVQIGNEKENVEEYTVKQETGKHQPSTDETLDVTKSTLHRTGKHDF